MKNSKIHTLFPSANPLHLLYSLDFDVYENATFDLFLFESLKNVKTLSVRNVGTINPICLKTKMDCNLHTLYFTSNKLATIPLHSFLPFDNLGVLIMTRGDAQTITMVNCGSNSRLYVMDFQSNRLTHLNLSIFSSSIFPNLRFISFWNNEIKYLTLETDDTVSFQRLTLSSNHLTSIDLNMFVKMKSLYTLDVAYNLIDYIQPLKGNVQFERLESLDLSNNLLQIIPPLCQPSFDLLDSGFEYDVSKNPLKCSRNMLWVKECVHLVKFNGPICHSPKRNIDKHMLDLSRKELFREYLYNMS